MESQIPITAAFSKAINALLDRKGFPPLQHGRVEAFSTLIGWRSRSTVHRWLSGNGMPSYNDLIDIALLLNCTTDQLLGIQTTTSTEEPEAEMLDVIYVTEDAIKRRFPFPRALIDRRNRVGPFGVLRVTGNEMADFLKHNDCAIFDLGQTEIHSGSYYVLEICGKMVVRRLRISLTQRIDVFCENEKIPFETVDSHQIIPHGQNQPADPPPDQPYIYICGLVIGRYRLEN